MEQGSLVQEALQYMQQARNTGAGDGFLQNSLWIDAFQIVAPTTALHLATLCIDLNNALQSILCKYPWHVGGDGPVFGVLVTNGVPHVRAICRYGQNVTDEWVATAGVLQLSRTLFTNLAFQCWDLDDGHIVLIEAARQLPPWVDEISPESCRYRSWIINGSITLIRPDRNGLSEQNLTLKEALDRISTDTSLERPLLVQMAIEQRIHTVQQPMKSSPPNWSSQLHRSAIILPRNIAQLLHSHPHLANCAVTAFAQRSYSQHPPMGLDASDWVCTVHTFAKTSYAMLRTLVTPIWTTEDYIPYKSIEIARMKRLCQVESTPHLAHALQVGVRLTAGVDYIMGEKESHDDVTPFDRVTKHWAFVDVACGGTGAWLQQAFLDGPNNSSHDLEPLMKCPLYDIDLNVPCPLSDLGTPLQTLFKKQLKECEKVSINFSLPGPGDVDNETWMNIREADWEGQGTSLRDSVEETQNPDTLTNMLGSFQSFVDSKSEVEGISHENRFNHAQDDKVVNINPRVFMHLLHKVLSSSPQEIRDLVNCDELSSYFGEGDDDDDDDDKDEEVVEMMNAMDMEIQERGVEMHNAGTSVDDDAAVLSNLLESLNGSGGGPGPVQNILKEMGMDPPKLHSDSDD